MYYIYGICNNVTVWHLRYGSNLIMYYGIYNMVTAIQPMHDEYNNVIPTTCILRENIIYVRSNYIIDFIISNVLYIYVRSNYIIDFIIINVLYIYIWYLQ